MLEAGKLTEAVALLCAAGLGGAAAEQLQLRGKWEEAAVLAQVPAPDALVALAVPSSTAPAPPARAGVLVAQGAGGRPPPLGGLLALAGRGRTLSGGAALPRLL